LDHLEFLELLSNAAQNNASLEVRFACLAASAYPANEFGPHERALGVQILCDRLRVPSACRDLAMLAVRVGADLESLEPTNSEALCDFIESVDGFRQPQRFGRLTEVLGLLSTVSPRLDNAGRAMNAVRLAYLAASRLDAKSVARAASLAGLSGPAVGQAIRRARIELIAAVVDSRLTDDRH